MPWKTKSGSHYHLTEGCHGATIPCDTNGLTPCSTCCGSNGNGGSAQVPSAPSAMAGGSPAAVSAPGTDFETPGNEDPASGQSDSGTDATNAPASRLGAISDVVDAGMSALSEGMPAPDGEGIAPSDIPKEPPVEGLDYEGRGKGWPIRKRGKRYYRPGGDGYSYLTRRQAGIVYAAAKRGDVSMDRQHSKEMYDIVGRGWGDLDVHDREIFMHVSSAIDHIIAGRYELAQAELDGRDTEMSCRVVGTRKVTVTEDNWIDFAFDIEHEYEVGDIAEEEVTEDFWRVTGRDWD